MPEPSVRRLGDDWTIPLPQDLDSSVLKTLVLRAFGYPMTRRVRLERRSIRLTVDQSFRDPQGVGSSLSLALSGGATPLSPRWLVSAFEVGTVFRCFRDCVTRIDLSEVAPGRFRLRWPPTALSALEVLKTLPGIVDVRPRPHGTDLVIDVDGHFDHRVLIVVLEQRLTPSLGADLSPAPPRPLRWIKTNLALCGAGQFLFPPLIPLASVILVLSRLPQIRQALEEARQQKIGTPFFRFTVLACSVAAMTPFASALADWLKSYWDRRWRKDLHRETELLISALDIDSDAALVGESFRLETGMIAPREGRVEEGALWVQNGWLDPSMARKRRLYPGMPIHLGDRVLEGSGTIRTVPQSGPSRLEALIDRIRDIPKSLDSDPDLLAEARRVSDQTVSPNLLLALIALSVGGLPMASVILNQNWHTSPQILSTTEFLQDLRMSLLTGFLVTHPAAYKALAEIDVLVIDFDHPALSRMSLKIRDIDGQDKPRLRTPGWATQLSLFLEDARAEAFEQLGQSHLTTATSASLTHHEPGSLHLRIDARDVCLKDLDPDEPSRGCLLEIPGEPDEVVLFEESDTLVVRETFDALRDLGVSIWLVGGTRPTPELNRLGAALGAERWLPGPLIEETEAQLDTLRREGRQIAWIPHGSLPLESGKPQDLLLTSWQDMPPRPRVVGLLTDDLAGLPQAIRSAKSHPDRVQDSLPASFPANLLCIAGGFAGAINGVFSVLLTHLGVMHVSQHQRNKLLQQRLLPPNLEHRLASNADQALTSSGVIGEAEKSE